MESLSLQERRRGRKNSFFNGKEGRVGFRKKHYHDEKFQRYNSSSN